LGLLELARDPLEHAEDAGVAGAQAAAASHARRRWGRSEKQWVPRRRRDRRPRGGPQHGTTSSKGCEALRQSAVFAVRECTRPCLLNGDYHKNSSRCIFCQETLRPYQRRQPPATGRPEASRQEPRIGTLGARPRPLRVLAGFDGKPDQKSVNLSPGPRRAHFCISRRTTYLGIPLAPGRDCPRSLPRTASRDSPPSADGLQPADGGGA
jgi:hypothetical protein